MGAILELTNRPRGDARFTEAEPADNLAETSLSRSLDAGISLPNLSERSMLQRSLAPSTAFSQIEDISNALKSAGNREAYTNFHSLLKRDIPNASDLGTEQRTLLDNIHRLATHTPANKAEAQAQAQTLTHLLEHLAKPDTIHQDSTATCTMTTMQRSLAGSNPAEYARIVTELFTSKDGKVLLADGQTIIQRNADYLTRQDPSRDPLHPPRDFTEILVQDALMSKAAELSGGRYNAQTDTVHRDYDQKSQSFQVEEKGIHKPIYQRMYSALTNRATNFEIGNSTGLVNNILERAETLNNGAGNPIPVEIALGSSAGDHALHMVSVTGVVEVNGERFVQIYNPWGVTEGALNNYNNNGYQKNFGSSWQAVQATTGDIRSGKYELMSVADFKARLSGAMLENGLDASKAKFIDMRLPTAEELRSGQEFNFPRNSEGAYEIQVSTLSDNISKSKDTSTAPSANSQFERSLTLDELNALIAKGENSANPDATTNEQLIKAAYHMRKQAELGRSKAGYDNLSEIASSGKEQKEGEGSNFFWSQFNPTKLN